MNFLSFPLQNQKSFILDFLGGTINLKTHSQNELIIDARKMVNKGLIPKTEIKETEVKIGFQKLSSFFPQKEKIDLTIIVPENSEIISKVFSGNIILSGLYKSLLFETRVGNIIVENRLEVQMNSKIKLITGDIKFNDITIENMQLINKTDNEIEIQYFAATLIAKTFLGTVRFNTLNK